MPPGYQSAHAELPTSGLLPLDWTDHGFRIDSKDAAFGVHFLLGGLLIQEEAAMMAVSVLAPAPGERILDLCAAPGNKTVQLAAAVGTNGCVVANDVSESRLQVLRGLVDRFSLANVQITVHDGASYPERVFEENQQALQFDATLVDVPCSCEGTCRKNPAVMTRRGDARRDALPHLQEALLRRAIRLTRPGGRILYATCTFAPEENEEVVDRVLSKPEIGHEVSLEPINIPGVELDPGIAFWNGRHFDSALTRSARVWPHRNNTGGFYLALLRKADTAERTLWPTTSSRGLPGNEFPWTVYELDHAFRARFTTRPSGRKHNRLISSGMPELPFNVISEGMSGLNLKSDYPRPSSSLAAFLAPHAGAGVADISKTDILPFLHRETISPQRILPPADRSRYVLVRSGAISLGLGHVDRSGQIESLFPSQMAGLPVRDWLIRLGED